MKKKVLSTILAGVLALSAFAGCGSSTEESTDTSAATKLWSAPRDRKSVV